LDNGAWVQKTGMMGYQAQKKRKKFEEVFSRFDTTQESDGQTSAGG